MKLIEPKGGIYALIDPRTDKIIYVGSSYNPDRRVRHELLFSYARSKPLNKWVQELTDLGLTPGFRILERCPIKNLLKREQAHIEKSRNEGHPLLNVRPAHRHENYNSGLGFVIRHKPTGRVFKSYADAGRYADRSAGTIRNWCDRGNVFERC